MAAIAVLSRVSGVLALPVITHAYARLMGREPFWLRTATALNWSFWLLIPLLFVAAFIGAALVTAGVPNVKAEESVIVLLGAYMLWLHWLSCVPVSTCRSGGQSRCDPKQYRDRPADLRTGSRGSADEKGKLSVKKKPLF